jgi:mannose-1-phosphate guanylyltransferase
MEKNYYAMIMAGGGGTRLWPISRQSKPKQALRISGQYSLFQLSVARLQPLFDPAHIYVVTNEEQAQLLSPQAPSLPPENYLIEPSPKGTAAVVGLAAMRLYPENADCVIACVTADHFIRNVEKFQGLLQSAYQLAQAGHLVTLGIRPERPDTGYGYIHRGDEIDTQAADQAYHVVRFREKPNLGTAQEYLESGEYYWNSGMFVWRADRILAEIERQLPDLYAVLQAIGEAAGTSDEAAVLEAQWATLENITVDYGIMEGAQDVVVLTADQLGWLDIGSWSRMFDLFDPDAAGNVLQAPEVLVMDSQNSLVFQELAEDQGRLVALLGVKDLIVVDSHDIILVCDRRRAQDVRELVRKLMDDQRRRFL